MKKRRIPPLVLTGKVKILGNIVSPIVDEEDWDFEFPFAKARQITPAESQKFSVSLAEPLPWRNRVFRSIEYNKSRVYQ